MDTATEKPGMMTGHSEEINQALDNFLQQHQ